MSVASVDSSVSFTCNSDVEPKWNRGGLFLEMPHYVDVYENNDTLHTITIPNLRSKMSGQYMCYGTTNGLKFKAITDLYVGSEYLVFV